VIGPARPDLGGGVWKLSVRIYTRVNREVRGTSQGSEDWVIPFPTIISGDASV